jgi:hypothetical protein
LSPGTVPAGLGAPSDEPTNPVSEPRLWSSTTGFTIDVRRYGEEWIRLAEVPAGRDAAVTLPHLDSAIPWQIRADGACDVSQ